MPHSSLFLQPQGQSFLLPYTWDCTRCIAYTFEKEPKGVYFLNGTLTRKLSRIMLRWETVLKKQDLKPLWKTVWRFLKKIKNRIARTSMVVQCLRIRLPMRGTRVRALVREDPTCCGATKPVRHNYWACTLARVPRACAPQQGKPPQWEAHTPQQRVAPARRN